MSVPCPTCHQPHVTSTGKPSCAGHVTTDRDSYVKGQDRKRLDAPRPCKRAANRGLPTCQMHGSGNPNAAAAGQQRETERKARRLLGDSGETVTDPIAKLCAIAGRAVAFMEALGKRVDQLGEEADADQVRAEIAVYGRSIKDAAGVVESIIRMGIAERLAKAEAEQTSAIVAFIDAVLTDLGHNPRDPEVAGAVARRLELVS